MDSCISDSRGLGLIELLIAMALGLTLAAGVMQVYAVNSQLARELEARIHVQENGRLALHYLVQELRAATYPACPQEQRLVQAVEGSPLPEPVNIRGWEAEGTGFGDIHDSDSSVTVVDSNQGGWLTSTDEKMVRFSLLPGSDVIQINDLCVQSTVFTGQEQEDGGTQGTLFYVGKRGNAAENPPALFRRSASESDGRAEELFEGVASLQILYGLERDDEHTPPDYLVASDVADWRRVRSLRISLLLQSVEDGLVAAPQPYIFQGVRYDGTVGNGPLPGDRRLRRVFTTTLALRPRNVSIFPHRARSSRKNQHGAALLFCLVFLALLTMTATVSMEAAIVEQRAAGRMQDYQIASRAAEAARDMAGEWLVARTIKPPASADGSTIVWQHDALDPDTSDAVPWWQDAARQQSWWLDNAQIALEMKGLAAPPQYIIEELLLSDEELPVEGEADSRESSQNGQRIVYRISASGSGKAETSRVTLQSIRVVYYE